MSAVNRDVAFWTDPATGVRQLVQVVRDNLDGTFQVERFQRAGGPDANMMSISSSALSYVRPYGSWTRAFEVDLTAIASTTFPIDATGLTYAGYSAWEKKRSANEATALTQTLGTGLIFAPAQVSNASGGLYTAPTFALNVISVVPEFELATQKLRWWASLASQTPNPPNTNSQNAFLGYSWRPGAQVDCGQFLFRGFNGGQQEFTMRNMIVGTDNDTAYATATAGAIVMMVELTRSNINFYTGALSGGAFPSPAAMTCIGHKTFGDYAFNSPFAVPANGEMQVCLGGIRAGAAGAATFTFNRIALDYGWI